MAQSGAVLPAKPLTIARLEFRVPHASGRCRPHSEARTWTTPRRADLDRPCPRRFVPGGISHQQSRPPPLLEPRSLRPLDPASGHRAGRTWRESGSARWSCSPPRPRIFGRPASTPKPDSSSGELERRKRRTRWTKRGDGTHLHHGIRLGSCRLAGVALARRTTRRRLIARWRGAPPGTSRSPCRHADPSTIRRGASRIQRRRVGTLRRTGTARARHGRADWDAGTAEEARDFGQHERVSREDRRATAPRDTELPLPQAVTAAAGSGTGAPSCAANLPKNSSASLRDVAWMRRPPSEAILPPISALAS